MKKIFSFLAAALFAGSMMAADALNTDFAKGQGEWTIKDVELDGLSYVWNFDSKNNVMKASAYVNKANHATESWLVSPAFDLSEAKEATLKVSHMLNYASSENLLVKISEDGENWNNIVISAWPAGKDWNPVDATADLKDFLGKKNLQVAFVYVSTTEVCPTWELKTVAVETDGEGQGGDDPDPQDTGDLATSGVITVTPADVEGLEEGASSFDQVINGIKIVWSGAFYNGTSKASNNDFRIYAGKTMTISAGANIVKVEIAGLAKKDLEVSVDKGSITTGGEKFDSETTKGDIEDPLVVIEDIKDKSVVISCTKQMQARIIRVTLADGPTAISNTELKTKGVKSIVNGQLVIEKKGVRYNANGAVVR